MPKNEKPKDITEIPCWNEAREFANLVMSLTQTESLGADHFLTDLIKTSCLSMMAQISDGYHRRSNQAFEEHLEEAKGFLGQTISHLYVAFDQQHLDHDQLNDTLSKAYTVGIRINSHLKTLQPAKK